MCQGGWWRWDAPGKVGGTAGASAEVALGDTAQLLPSPSCCPPAFPAGSSVTPGFGICHLQGGNAGSRDSVSGCALGFLQAGFRGLERNFSFSRWFCHLMEIGAAQRCPRIPNSRCSHQLSRGWVPGRSLELRGDLESSPGHGCGVGSECCRNRTKYTFGVELGS